MTSEVVTGERSPKDDFLVYQMTFLPSEPLSLDWVDADKPEAANDAAEIPGNAKAELEAVHEKWIACDVNCTIGADDTIRGIMGRRNGFGYSSSSKAGVTALYYYPTEKEFEAWKRNRPPCAARAP